MLNDNSSLTVPQAARELGLNEETVRRNIRSRRLAATRIGNQYFISKESLGLFLSQYDRRTGRLRSPI